MPVDEATVARLRAHDWGADPFERVQGFGEPYRIRLVEGRCFFLDDDDRCRIHAKISYQAKPAVCRAFPLAVLDVHGKQYARLSFWCPTVARNIGRPLEHQASWVNDAARRADVREAPLTVDGRTALSWPDFQRVHDRLRGFLLDRSLSVGDRLAAGAALLRRLEIAARSHEQASTGAIANATAGEAAVLAREAQSDGDPAVGRRLLALYLLHERDGARLGRVARFLSVVMFTVGAARLRSPTMAATAGWREVHDVAFGPTAASEGLLTRYFGAKLDSYRYVAGGVSLIAGFNLLVAAYGLINLLARMRAASEARRSCDEDDVRLAVEAADWLALEHHGLHSAVQDRLTAEMLGRSDLCGSVLACLEGTG